ncbi:MAG TPA: hypothetical protein VE709_06365 [Pseudonocardiaceae bacterium]|nr:hypothetical protein [Pseudonocardiaceae bacterium]
MAIAARDRYRLAQGVSGGESGVDRRQLGARHTGADTGQQPAQVCLGHGVRRWANTPTVGPVNASYPEVDHVEMLNVMKVKSRHLARTVTWAHLVIVPS